MKRRNIILIITALSLQIYCVPLIQAEPAAGLAGDSDGKGLEAVLLDSLQTHEPPGITPVVDTVYATYYSHHFHGHRTASGVIFDRNAFTCAHKTLPFNTLIKVTNPQNNKSVIVRVTDRGPFKKNRKLDLSYSAAKELGMLKKGVMQVIMEVLPPDTLGLNLAKKS